MELGQLRRVSLARMNTSDVLMKVSSGELRVSSVSFTATSVCPSRRDELSARSIFSSSARCLPGTSSERRSTSSTIACRACSARATKDKRGKLRRSRREGVAGALWGLAQMATPQSCRIMLVIIMRCDNVICVSSSQAELRRIASVRASTVTCNVTYIQDGRRIPRYNREEHLASFWNRYKTGIPAVPPMRPMRREALILTPPVITNCSP